MKEFEEHKRFTKWWLWLPLICLLLFLVFGFLKQVVLGVPFGDNPMSNLGFGLLIVLVLLVLVVFMTLQLHTLVNAKGLFINFGIFGKYNFAWSEVRSVKLVNVGFVGYGLRVSANHGKVFNLGGKKGLEINLKNNKRYTLVVTAEANLRQTLKALKKLK